MNIAQVMYDFGEWFERHNLGDEDIVVTLTAKDDRTASRLRASLMSDCPQQYMTRDENRTSILVRGIEIKVASGEDKAVC